MPRHFAAMMFIEYTGSIQYIQYTVYSIQYTIYSIQYTVYTIQYTVYTIQYTVYSIQYTVYMQSVYIGTMTHHIVQCTELHEMYRKCISHMLHTLTQLSVRRGYQKKKFQEKSSQVAMLCICGQLIIDYQI